MNEEFYFTLHLTENEHAIVESEIREYCLANNMVVLYYRTLKHEHVPTQRECKIVGNSVQLNKFRKWCQEQSCPIILENFWNTQDGIDHLNDVKNHLARGSTRCKRIYGN